MKDKKDDKKTDFQGPVSLEAILAATSSGNKPTEPKKTFEPAAPAKPNKEEEEKGEEPGKETTDNKKEPEIPQVPAPAEEDKGKAAEPKKEDSKQTTDETEAFKVASRLISLGLLEDFRIQVSEEDEEGTLISEFKDMTDENLEEIINIHKQEQEKEISSKYLPKGDLKEHQLKVFEILSNGGDLSQIAETPEKALERPFEGFDMEDQQRQIDVRYTDLVHSKGLDHESAIALIDNELKSGKLEATAKKTFDAYRAAHAKYIDEMLEKQKKDKEFKDLNFKENKKSLVAKLKEAGLKESVYRKVATEYEKKNEDGDYVLIDKLREALENPADNHELILHLTDKKLFNEVFKIKSAEESHKTIVRLATGVSAKGNRKKVKNNSEEEISPWVRNAQIHNESLQK